MRERAGYERPSAFVRRRGSFMDKGEQVYAGVPATLHPLPDDQMPNRLGLAHWLADEKNPLTARVAVNRAWEQFFGRGIVETSEDFGTQGSPPSHPELLDWLATEFVDQGWRTKAIHKLIVTSATYRQSSAATPALEERDPANRPARARSAFQAGSGNGPRHGAGGERTPQPEDRRTERVPAAARRHLGHPVQQREMDAERGGGPLPPRPLRLHPPLGRLPELHDVRCDEPGARDRAAGAHQHAAAGADHAERRGLLRGRAGAGGPRAARDTAVGRNCRADAGPPYAFRLVATRTPEPGEVERIVASYTRQLERFRKDPEAAARTIKGYAVADIAAAEQAAWTLVANALLNLDEALTKQ